MNLDASNLNESHLPLKSSRNMVILLSELESRLEHGEASTGLKHYSKIQKNRNETVTKE